MALNSTEEIIEDLRQGKMVIIMDDEDRENEGDLVIAADKVTPEAINFMAKYGRGLICLTLTRERCQQLRLPLMVNANDQLESTNFTISIEAAEGVTTGISAADRARTVLAAVKPDARPEDLVQPGHIFPLMAQPGGVLVRAGHTEAGCDLARLAGSEPAAVIVDDLKIGTIADLIEYRVRNEKTVERINECLLPTEAGEFRVIAYQDVVDNEVHLALLGASYEECGWPLKNAMKQIEREGSGIVVILRNHDTARDIVQRIQACQLKGGSHKELRTFGVGAQILIDLGVKKMRVMSAPKHLHALAGFHLEVTEFVDFELPEGKSE